MPKHVNKSKILPTFLKVLIILCPVFTVLAFLFAFSPIAKAYSSYTLNGINSNTVLHCDNNGVYISAFNGNRLEVNYITNNSINTHAVEVQGEIKGVTTDNGNIYAISKANNTLYLNRYLYSTATLNSFIIETDSMNSDYKFAVAGDRLYFAENNDYSQIACHSINGEKLYSFYVSTVIDYLTDCNGILYISNANELYTVDTTYNSQPQCKFSNINIRGDIFICDNTLFDYNGNIINLQNGYTIPTNIITHSTNAAVINDYYCKYSSGNIYGYTKNGTANTLYHINAGANAQLCGFNNTLYILSDKMELFIINESKLKFPQNSTTPPDTYTPNTSTNNSTNQNQPTNNNRIESLNNNSYSFSINNYYIDKVSNIIWNIPDNTTISTFKNNLTYNGYSLEFYNSNMVKKYSGKIGTGFTMVVKDNVTEHSRYTISVKGDLSGDGNINRTDVTLLSDYLMSSTTLSNEQYASADINADNIIDGLDILKIAKNNL